MTSQLLHTQPSTIKCLWCPNKALYAQIYSGRFVQVCYPHKLAINQSFTQPLDKDNNE